MFNNKKVIVVEPDYDGCYDSTYDVGVKTTVVDSVTEMVKIFQGDMACEQVVKTLLENPHFIKALDAAGFRNIEALKRVAEQVVSEDRYYLCENSYGFGSPREIDLEKISNYDAEKLANPKNTILQAVKPSTLKATHPKAYKAYLAAKKKAAENEVKKQKALEAKQAKKKAKEIEKAKKLLEEAGEN